MKVRRLILGALSALLLAAFPAASPAAASCPAPTTGYPGAVMGTSGLAAYWRLGETSGTVACDATGVNSGTYQGAYTLGQPGAIAGDPNTAVALDGTTGQVSVPDSSSLDTGDAFTIEAWVKRAAPNSANWQVIVSKQSGSWLLMFDESNRLVLRRAKYSNVAYSVGRVTDTNWHYVAATKNGAAINLYIDGQASNGTIANATMTDNTSPLAIGQSNSTSFFPGTIDDLAIYRTALTPAQIAAHYNAGAPPAPAPTPDPTPTPTPAPSGSDPQIAAAGDIACDPADPFFNNGQGTPDGCHQLATSKLVVGTGLNGVLTLGDEQYDDASLAKFQQVYDTTWGKVNNLGHPGIGNHEYLTSAAKGYFDYFDGVGQLNGPAGPRGKGYYSFDVGTWHIIALNSNCSYVSCASGSAQEQWLKSDLAAHPTACTLAYWHHPRFSSGGAGSIAATGPLFTDLYNAGADVVLNGHDHDYERFAPQTPAAVADSAKGITEFVVGTGGKSLKPFASVQRNSLVRNSSTYGVLRMTLHPKSYDFKFVPEAGKTFTDSGTVACH